MQIHGFQKLTLLDFPGKTACTVFTGGCNLRCPFCHNALLVTDLRDAETYSEEEILSFLKKRQGLLDGVAITGGEPLLQADIGAFIARIKELGFAVKLDTNGTFPERLEELITAGAVDYVAMDIKNTPSKYPETVGVAGFDIAPVQKSAALLLQNRVPYEFRTTVVREFHTVKEIAEIAMWLRGAERYFLQAFTDSGNLIGQGMSGVPKAEMEEMCRAARQIIPQTELRGV